MACFISSELIDKCLSVLYDHSIYVVDGEDHDNTKIIEVYDELKMEVTPKKQESLKKSIDSLSVKDNEIILLKGYWEADEIQSFASLTQHRKMNNIIVVVPSNKSLEALPNDEFSSFIKVLTAARDATKNKISDDATQTEKIKKA